MDYALLRQVLVGVVCKYIVQHITQYEILKIFEDIEAFQQTQGVTESNTSLNKFVG